MKTPRDLILRRCAPVNPRLDALRRHIVAEHAGNALPACVPPTARLWTLWHELVRPHRAVWATLALAWLFILMVHGFGQEPPLTSTMTSTKGPFGSPELPWILAEEARLRAEILIDPAGSEAQDDRPPGPRSQSEAKQRPT